MREANSTTRGILDKINSLLLSLYAATAEVDPADFTQTAMTLLQNVVAFDSSGYSALDTRSSDVLVLGSDTFRETPNLMREWQKVNAADPVTAQGLAQPGRATTFHAPILIRSLKDASLIDYLDANRHHQNGIAVILPGKSHGCWEAAGFYRADREKQFSHEDIRMVELLAPHFLQAARLNRKSADLTGTDVETDYAIVNKYGQIKFASDAFDILVRREWPQWRGNRLPAALMDALRSDKAMRYNGALIEGTSRFSGDMLIVHLQAVSALATLTPREAVVAKLFGAGMPTKEIAQQMHISPNTVRNFVQRVYKKLDVNDKAALAVMLATLGKR